MSNSFPERNKTSVLEAFDTLFNNRDYAGEAHLVTVLHSAERTDPSRSARADRDPASDAQVRAGDHPSRKGLGDRAGSLLVMRRARCFPAKVVTLRGKPTSQVGTIGM
jgi:hypothetical protein